MDDDTQPVDGLVYELEDRRKRDKTRKYVYILFALWLGTAAALVVVAWNGYFKEKDKALTLAQQVAVACDTSDQLQDQTARDFGYYLSPEEEKALCSNAKKVIEQNDPELQDQEIQESEIQDPEIQDPEIQNKEKQNPEAQDAETQDPEIQDEETQDPEIQDPEIDDPDPNDQIKAGTCTFDGTGTIKFAFQTDNGPVEFECTGTSGLPTPDPSAEPTP